MGTAYSILDGSFKLLPALLCGIFAVLAQISSNFANEYYDFRDGLDKVGRDGPRRGVTEGDITLMPCVTLRSYSPGIACLICCR